MIADTPRCLPCLFVCPVMLSRRNSHFTDPIRRVGLRRASEIGQPPREHSEYLRAHQMSEIVASVGAAMHELHAPATAEPRRRELQGMLHRERERATADAALRAVWRGVIGTTNDELLLWFALSCIGASLTGTSGASIAIEERAELTANLQTLLLGPSAATLPASSRSKGVTLLAQLARVAWPAEQPALLHEVLNLLRQPGSTRVLGARILSAVVDEFGAAKGERPSVQASRQAALVSFLPDAHAALTEALQSEAANAAAAAAAAAPSARDAGGAAGAETCLEAARALLTFGRVRDGADGARTFTEAELRSAPPLLQAAAAFLTPRGASDVRAAVGALTVLSELSELQDAACAALLRPLVQPMVLGVQQLASQPVEPYGGSLDDLESAMCYASEQLCGWLLGPHLQVTISTRSPHELSWAPVLSRALLRSASPHISALLGRLRRRCSL